MRLALIDEIKSDSYIRTSDGQSQLPPGSTCLSRGWLAGSILCALDALYGNPGSVESAPGV